MKKVLFLSILIFLMAACNPTETPVVTVPPIPPTLTQAPQSIPPTNTPQATTTELPTATVTATVEVQSIPTLTPEPILYGPDNMPASINPLTGLAVGNPALLDRRPVAVKINIVPRTSTRPPWGLSFADIVYDYYHNDGYSRFFALFYGQDAELAGPIRSGRLLDHELVRMYKSVFAYGSADQIINQRFFNADYSSRLVLEGSASNCPPTASNPLCRFDPQGYSHLLAGTQELGQYAASRGVDNVRQDLSGMTFHAPIPAGGGTANQIFIRYSGDNYVRWDYDSASGKYLRFQDNVFDQGQGEDYAPLVDRLNNRQVSADNVVILVARHEYYQQPPNEIVEILLSGSGKAYVYRDGQMFNVSWSRPTISSVLYLTYPDGSAFPYKPGITWYQVIGESTAITQPENASWRYDFHLP